MPSAPPFEPELGAAGGPVPARRGGCLKKLGIGCAGLFGLIMIGVVAFGLMIEQGLLPDSVALWGEEIPGPARRTVESMIELGADEELVMVYSAGVFSWEEDGQFLTETRVGSWQSFGEEIDLAWCWIDEITHVDFDFQDSFWEDSTIRVEASDGSVFVMLVPSEDGSDHRAADWLLERLPEGAVKHQ